MKIEMAWEGGASFAAENEKGRRIVFDGPAEHGGKNLGMRPMEGVLSGAMACAALDVAHILKKSGKGALHSLRVRGEADRADAVPGVFTRIHLHFVAGGNLREAAVDRAVQLGVEKYCSALSMLGKTADITHSWEIQAS